MSRKLVAHRLVADPAWYAAIRTAWNGLDDARGQKKKVYEAAGMSRSTANRISTAKDGEVSFDTLEALRIAINEERGSEVIPPAFIPVVSTDHLKVCQAAAALNRRGRLAKLATWTQIGMRLDGHGQLDAMIDALEHRLAALDALEKSSDAIEGTPASPPTRPVRPRR